VPLTKRQRRIFRGLILFAAGTAALWLALPLWFPWVFRPIAAANGLSYQGYTRESYSRLRLTGVQFRSGSTELRVGAVEAFVPSIWLWELSWGSRSNAIPFLVADHWELFLKPSTQPASSVNSGVRQLENALGILTGWLPSAVLSNGTIHASARSISVPEAFWSNASLNATAELPAPVGFLRLGADFAPGLPVRIRLDAPRLDLQSETRVTSTSTGSDFQSSSLWWSNRIGLEAHFSRDGTLPETASVQAQTFRIPARVLDVPQYQDVTGSASARWEKGGFSATLQATSQPSSNRADLPPLELQLRVRGDTNTATIETATLSSPMLSARISNPLTVDFQGRFLSQPVALTLAADLGRQPWIPVQGELGGAAEIEPGSGNRPAARFQLSGTGIGTADLKSERLEVRGDFHWPWMTIARASAEFKDGSSVSIKGALDITQRIIRDGQVQFVGRLVNRWLPPGYSCESVAGSGEFSGPLSNLVHHGTLTVTNFNTPSLRPIQLHAQWRGEAKRLAAVRLNLAGSDSSVQAEGALSMDDDRAEVLVRELKLITNTQPALELSHPMTVSVTREHDSPGWSFSLPGMDWTGPAGRLEAKADFAWPNQGALQLKVQGLDSSLIDGFSKAELPPLRVHALEGSAAWSNGPITFAIRGAISERSITPKSGASSDTASPANPGGAVPGLGRQGLMMLQLMADANISGGPGGITISNFTVLSSNSTLVTVHGFVPLTFNPAGGSDFIRLDSHEPLRLEAATEPEAAVWNSLGDWSGLALTEPKLAMNLAGTWETLSGQMSLQAREIRLKKPAGRLPAVGDVNVVLRLDSRQVELTDGRFSVQGQPVLVDARLPLSREFWESVRKGEMPDWSRGTARVQIHNAEVGAFAPIFPEILGPDGRLDLDLAMLPGRNLSGTMHLQEARTKPLSDLGAFRHIDVKLRFVDQRVRLESARADIGGANVALTGAAELSGTRWWEGETPPFEISLYGTNVALVRQPEIIVRSDLELAVTHTNGAPALVTGLVRLRDGFFLADLSALVPGKVSGPALRPPYFSLTTPPLDAWRLAVTVQGVRFMRVQTPIFSGRASANLKIQGTMKEPVALGDLRVDSGTVRFPFGSLEVHQGLINLTSQDPYHPQLNATAGSKQFGYDIRMEASGPVDAPVLQFSSTPPLSSEQILLMLTAGQLPQGTYTLSPQQRAQTVALFFGRDLLSKLGVGDEGQQRLSVRSGDEISEQGRPTYHVEYRFSKRWFLVGEYDRFGEYNAGFKWRILSR
jgi:translocation and assembly module TamB